MNIRIVVDVNGQQRIYLEETGEELKHVTQVDVSLLPMQPCKARVTFLLPCMDIHLPATVSEEHLRELAAAHGYQLVKRDTDECRMLREREAWLLEHITVADHERFLSRFE